MKEFNWRDLPSPPIIGVDEVGRGCLAGKVYAAAVILEPGEYSELTDSKKLSPNRRSELSYQLMNHQRCSIGFATVEEIEEINILQASLLAMKRAVINLNLKNGHLIIDGNQKIPGLEYFLQTTVIKGDLIAKPISAASIVAKVARDQYMTELSHKYPQYGFEIHKGYGTRLHLEALRKWGPCPEHRKTFSGVKECTI